MIVLTRLRFYNSVFMSREIQDELLTRLIDNTILSH